MHLKLHLFSYPSMQSCVLGAQKNRLIETVLLSAHNISFGLEIRKKQFSSTHSYLEDCVNIFCLIVLIGKMTTPITGRNVQYLLLEK